MTQATALTILKTGATVFLTGEPGSGKTHTINEYVTYLRDHGIEPAITASTGIAATHIHGQTIHSWSGIGIRKSLSQYDLETLATTEYLVRRIRKTQVLIIDEISMIDARTLDMVELVCRTIRQNTEAFGGLQVVLVGDFFQLPPITREGESAQFAFRAQCWKHAAPIVCYLTEQHRQEDQTLLELLTAIRAQTSIDHFLSHLDARIIEDELAIPEGVSVPRLFSHNANVDALNDRALAALDTPMKVFRMIDKGRASLVATLKKGCLSPEILSLKVGAVVMCTKNNPTKGFVNGTIGEVISFEKSTDYPIIQTKSGEEITIEPMEWQIEEDGKVRASISQIPLRLAWAITIHKSQGLSLDAAMMDLRSIFEYGQGYVALSRVRTLSGIYLAGWNERAFEIHPEIARVDVDFKEKSHAAEMSFGKLEDEELRLMHENFITACGGNLAVGKKKAGKPDTLEETKALLQEGLNLKEIAARRKLVVGTVLDHLEKLAEAGRIERDELAPLIDPTLSRALPNIEAAFKTCNTELLAPVRTYLKGAYTYDTLRLARLIISLS
jgi:hypothetical protein